MNETAKTSPESIKLQVIYDEAPRNIIHVNFGKLSHVGGDVFLDLGVVDDQFLLAIRSALLAGQTDVPREVPAYVTHRFGMSTDGLELLRRNIEDIWQKLKKAGLIREPAVEPGSARAPQTSAGSSET
jgi:hypothetical protein